MDPEMAKIGLYTMVALKGIFALLALFGVIRAKRIYRQLRGMQRVSFWIATSATAIALVWVASLGYLITHPTIAPSIPLAGWYFFIFASPAAAIAAGSAMGIFVPSTKTQ